MVLGVLRKLPQNVGPGCACDIEVVGEGSAVGGGAWEGVLLTGLLCKITINVYQIFCPLLITADIPICILIK